MNFLNHFKLKENKTTVRTEVIAGITTFMTMAYILAVNPDILSAAGMDKDAVFTATALSAVIGTVCMALLANYPFALAPGMGLNAYFAYTVASRYSWQLALLAVLAEGVIFILLSFVNVRETIFNAIPINLKHAVSVGIGLFICFIGFQNAGIIVSSEATGVALGEIKSVPVMLSLIGVILTMFLSVKRVKGALLWGILGTYILGVGCQLIGLFTPAYSLIPSGVMSMPPSLAEINIFAAFGALDFSAVSIFDFIVVVFAFLFVDMFDTVGTLVGVSAKGGFLDKNGKLPRAKEALLADAIGTLSGAAMGTSTVTTFVESASGVADGGKTGLTSMVTALCFLLSLLFWPIFGVIPSFATAPALIVVGLFMFESVVKINFSDFTEGFPSFMAIIMMPLAYSIAEGLVFGFLSYVILKVICNKAKDVSIPMYVIAALFVVKIIVG